MDTRKSSTNNSTVSETLRNAIISLCLGTIPYKNQITIKGLIGITIDNDDVLLVDFANQADPFMRPTNGASVQNRPPTNSIKFRAIKTEQVIEWGHSRGGYQDNSTNSNDTKSGIKFEHVEDYVENDDCQFIEEEEGNEQDQNYEGYADEDNEIYDVDDQTNASTGLVDTSGAQNWNLPNRKLPGRNLPSKKRANQGFSSREQATKKRTRAHLDTLSKLCNPGYGVNRYKVESDGVIGYGVDAEDGCGYGVGDEQGTYEEVEGKPKLLESEFVQMYSCSICGQSIKHLSSFMRHKRQHDGTVYKCMACGKVFSRRDVLTAHKKKCQMLQAEEGVVYG